MQLIMAPVVTLAGGDLDRRGEEELAITVSAPTNHDNPTDAARCYIYTWDDTAKRLSAVVNDGLGNDYIPLSTTVGATSAMVSANCTFGTFRTSDTDTATTLIIAGWDCGGSSNAEYANFGYRYVYYDTSQDDFVVSDYYRKSLGKDASHITETAFKDTNQDGDTGRPWRPSPWVPHDWTASTRVPPRTTTSSWVGTSTRSVSPLG
jgi:hypothetical protein